MPSLKSSRDFHYHWEWSSYSGINIPHNLALHQLLYHLQDHSQLRYTPWCTMPSVLLVFLHGILSVWPQQGCLSEPNWYLETAFNIYYIILYKFSMLLPILSDWFCIISLYVCLFETQLPIRIQSSVEQDSVPLFRYRAEDPLNTGSFLVHTGALNEVLMGTIYPLLSLNGSIRSF